MRKITLLALLCLSLAACGTRESRRETYDMIREQLKAELAAQAKTQAANTEAVNAALLPPLTGAIPAPRPPLEERFSLALNNVSAQQFFNAVVAGTRYNMLVHPEVAGNLSANLKEVTLFEALDAIREVYGYDYKVEGNRIYIKPLTMQTRVFQVNYLTGSRQGSSDIRVTSGTVSDVVNNGNGGTSNSSNTAVPNGGNNGNNSNNNNQTGGRAVDSSRISTNSQTDFWSELKAALEAIVRSKGEGRSVVLSPQSGVVVVRAMPDEMRSVEEYLKATQVSVERQVILEAKILEVQLSDSYQTGINWASFASFSGKTDNRVSMGVISPGASLAPLPFTGGKPDPIASTGNTALNAITGFQLAAPSTAAGTLFGLAFQTSNFAALISFLESQGSVHVLSSPRIATMNNQKAVLKIGTDEFFVTGVTSNTTNTTNTNNTTSSPSVTLQPFFSGVVLDVTPQIDEHGNIMLHVHPSVSQVSTVNKILNLGTSGTFTLPLASSSTSETDSVVRGQDGNIVAIGGLMRQATSNDRSQVPGSGDIPLLGAVLGNKNQVTVKRELVILIKPTIVRGNQAVTDDLRRSLQQIDSMSPPRRQ